MKTTNRSMISSPGTARRSAAFGRISRAIYLALAALAWAFLIQAALLVGYFAGWVFLAAVLLRSRPTAEVLPVLLVLLAIASAGAWLVARYIAPARSVRRVIAFILALQLIGWAAWALISPDRALFLARQVAWGDSGQQDYQRFPERVVGNASPVFRFEQDLSPELFQTIEYRSEGQPKQAGFEEFLQSTHTTSFIVIQDDAILYEGYFNGYSRDSIVTSFSVAKSFISALVGIAIEEGYIHSVNDPFIDYIPELKSKGFDGLTIRHLLDMSSGIQFLKDDEISPLKNISQFTDDGLSYSYPNLRDLALQIRPDGGPAGAQFNYNNYHPLLLGMILERTTGRPVAEYLQEKIWKPLGMEYPASWSLDSEQSGFELMGAGINGRAIDFARFGRLFLNHGDWNGRQVISEAWVTESTAPDPTDQRTWHSDADWKAANGYYKYLWWDKLWPDGSYDFAAQGKRGQWIYVAPQEKTIIVRFGLDEGGVDAWADVFRSVIDQVKGTASANSLPARDSGSTAVKQTPTTNVSPMDWGSRAPEEQGFDSEKLAEGLRAIRKNGTSIHSLMIIRNGSVILDAIFYPYDGSKVHDLASVTKSVMTTLIGIAADQGQLDLDQPMLAFFPGRAIANRDERKERITVRHLASMSSGLDCTWEGNERTQRQMRASLDWVQFVLDRKVPLEPGTRFVYCSPGMHLLSAILTEATGMTALEFARENLFEPLGITEVHWPADPQGYNHGWGDLCLRSRDLARLGQLFLNQGKWEGRQLVSRQWVAEATRKQISTRGLRVEDYGYGWWVGQPDNEPEFLATGNGGQKIKVYPDRNLIMVMTGGGFEYAEIEPYLLAALEDLEGAALPANPDGQKQLAAALAEVVQPPPARPVPALPEIAQVISGRTYMFGPEALPVRSVRLDFGAPAEATFQFDVAGEESPRVNGVGLDGVYRWSQQGRPVIARGRWEDGHTFVIDYNEGPGITSYMMRMSFEGSRLYFKISGSTMAKSITIEGWLEAP